LDQVGISFKKPSQVRPGQMMQLAVEYIAGPVNSTVDKSKFPPKSLELIIELLREDRWREIQIIEWIYLLESDFLSEEKNNSEDINLLAVLILKAALKEPSVLNLVLFRAALSLESNGEVFPFTLVTNIELLLNYEISDRDRARVELLILARDELYEQIARLTMQKGVSPSEYLNKLNLAKCTQLYFNICNALKAIASELVVELHAEWLIKVLQELSSQVRIETMNNILLRVEGLNRSQRIIDWLEINCDPTHEESLWFDLSGEAKKRLRELIKITDFHYVNQLSSFLTSNNVARALELSETEVKKIQARRKFWSHYKDSFLSVKVYVPKETYNLQNEFGYEFEGLHQFYKDDEKSEIIIFELTDYIIVEFMRGTASEIRLFPNNKRHTNLLLRNEKLSIEHITSLFELSVHDHVFLWQWACESWLRTNFKIFPDKGVNRFDGLPPASSKYDPSKGLPKPSDNLLQQRNELLESWMQMYLALEKKNKPASRKEFEIYENNRLAELYRYTGDTIAMVRNLDKAVQLGDMKAVKYLANWLLTKTIATKPERERGETLLKAFEIYEGKHSIFKQKIFVWNNSKREELIQEITERPIRKLPDSHIGINYKSSIYQLYILGKDHLAIFLDDKAYSPEEHPAIRSNINASGLKVAIL
tara:strand:- start:6461 stop:8413 length:1953 start_codon:yes stop_codon:yes gene_type:complete